MTHRRRVGADRATAVDAIARRYSMHLDGYDRVDRDDAGDADSGAPVLAPRTPPQRSRDSAIALPEPDDDGFASE
jgi:hypothetical protein